MTEIELALLEVIIFVIAAWRLKKVKSFSAPLCVFITSTDRSMSGMVVPIGWCMYGPIIEQIVARAMVCNNPLYLRALVLKDCLSYFGEGSQHLHNPRGAGSSK